MNDKPPKCYWCDNDAEGIDYREFDGGVVSKIVTCKRCFNLSTEYLRELRNNNKTPDDEKK
jgi:hypothetical protein